MRSFTSATPRCSPRSLNTTTASPSAMPRASASASFSRTTGFRSHTSSIHSRLLNVECTLRYVLRCTLNSGYFAASSSPLRASSSERA